MNEDDRQLELWNLLAIYYEAPERLEEYGAAAVVRVRAHIEHCEYCRARRDRAELTVRQHPPLPPDT